MPGIDRSSQFLFGSWIRSLIVGFVVVMCGRWVLVLRLGVLPGESLVLVGVSFWKEPKAWMSFGRCFAAGDGAESTLLLSAKALSRLPSPLVQLVERTDGVCAPCSTQQAADSMEKGKEGHGAGGGSKQRVWAVCSMLSRCTSCHLPQSVARYLYLL